MTEFVRVKDSTTGHESSVPKRFAEAYDGKGFTILADKDAADANGRGLPAKTSVKELQKKEPTDVDNTPPVTEPTAGADQATGTEATGDNTPPYSAPMADNQGSKPAGGKTR